MTVGLTGPSQPAAGISIPLPPGDPRWGELAFMNIGTPEDPAYLRWSPEGRYYRRWNTRRSPLAFMLVYLTELLKPLETPYGPVLSFSEFHLAMCEEAKNWMQPVGRRTGIIAPRGGGKALALDTPVLTANRSWVDHGDLAVGDQVFDDQGKPCSVVAVSPRWDDRPCYRLTFSDGEEIIADAEHEWFVADRYRTRPGVQSTREIASKWLLTDARGFKEVRYSTTTCGPLQYPEKSLPINPYVLGVWLGDGTSATGSVTSSLDDYHYLLPELRAEGEDPTWIKYPNKAIKITISKPRPGRCPREHPLDPPRPGAAGRYAPCKVCILQLTRKSLGYSYSLAEPTNQPLVKRLRNNNLLNNKHIPIEYFTASFEQRLALMQGLMDTDGSITKHGACEFGVTNEQLAYGTLRLIRSLGIKATIAEGRAKIAGVDKGPAWRIKFYTELPVFRLPRKVNRVGLIKAGKTRRIVNVEQVTPRTTSCIQVDSPSQLYLVGETLIPTHNSTLLFKGLPLWALAHGHRKFFMGYADTTGQASEHGDDLRDQLTTNQLLLFDYPELWTFRGGRNNQHMIETRPDMEGMYAAGFRKEEALEIYQSGGRVFGMAGLDKATLGKSRKIGRPDLFTVDDGEPSADGYARQGGIDRKAARLNTIRDVILRMTPHAAVLLSGTVTMPNSIADDLVRHALGEPTEKWVTEERFNAAYFNAIQHEGTPYERSLWPEKWSLEWLKAERDNNPQKYALHYANRPMTTGGHYWQQDDFQYGLHWPIAHYIMYVDPAEVADERRGDKTAWVVIGLDRPPPADRAVVLFVHQGHFDDTELGHQIVQFKRCNPQIPILDLYVEGYNSGALRYKTLKAMMPPDIRFPPDHMDRPGPMLGPAGEKGKDARIQRALPPYRQRRVQHLHPFSDLEALLTSYPEVRYKDLPDALAGALRKGLRD
jgi:hypothetical protein